MGNTCKKSKGVFYMKTYVDQDTCISCGMCVTTCNELYSFNDDGKAEAIVDTVPPELEEEAKQAADNCPVSAIETE